LVEPPGSGGEVRIKKLCGKCFCRIERLLAFGVEGVEDILSVGPAWLRCTKRIKRCGKPRWGRSVPRRRSS